MLALIDLPKAKRLKSLEEHKDRLNKIIPETLMENGVLESNGSELNALAPGPKRES